MQKKKSKMTTKIPFHQNFPYPTAPAKLKKNYLVVSTYLKKILVKMGIFLK